MISKGFLFKDISYFLKIETNTNLPSAIQDSIKLLLQATFRVQNRTSRNYTVTVYKREELLDEMATSRSHVEHRRKQGYLRPSTL